MVYKEFPLIHAFYQCNFVSNINYSVMFSNLLNNFGGEFRDLASKKGSIYLYASHTGCVTVLEVDRPPRPVLPANTTHLPIMMFNINRIS